VTSTTDFATTDHPAPQERERVVALTGAGRGLGLLTARTLLEQGASVAANHRSPSKELDQLAKLYPDRLALVPGDIAEESTAAALVEAAQDLGGIRALIHNAGVAGDKLLIRMSVEDWDNVMRVNLRGAFLTTKHALRPMMRKKAGRIIYVSSTVAYIGNPGQTAYGASKAGLQGLALSVAQEYRKYNIRTVVLALGLIDTGLGASLEQEYQDRLAGQSLAGMGDPEQAAQTLAFLTTPASEFISATVIRADGGMKYG
jgi:3-oxoacyl-[acyl-carrier protein] reductase